VEAIRGLANQIPTLQTAIETIRANQIPMASYVDLSNRVNTLWSEREQMLGTRRLYARVGAGIGLVGIIVAIVVALKTLGINISIK
jgi:hypothetical protein